MLTAMVAMVTAVVTAMVAMVTVPSSGCHRRSDHCTVHRLSVHLALYPESGGIPESEVSFRPIVKVSVR